MAKKKEDNKEIKIVIAILLIVFVGIGIFAYVNNQNKINSINQANKMIYDSLLCLSDCPVTVLLGNSLQAVFDEDCSDKCRTKVENIGLVLKGVNLYDKRVIVNSEEFNLCKNNFNLEKNADKYKACLQEILPVLKARFGISD